VAFAVAGRLGQTNDWDAVEGERFRLLDGEGLRSLGPLSIEVGAHSVTHRSLTAITPAELGAEVTRCRNRLASAGLGATRAFAYPYGRSNAAVVAAVRDAGFAAAFTTRSGLVTASSDRYRLPRMEVRRADTGLRLRLRLAAARAPGPVRAVAAHVRRPARHAFSPIMVA
jgi:peptidoglycan/xylan/chitin deacetylase (PgdA/CDA1 family)